MQLQLVAAMDLAARFQGFDSEQLTIAWHVYSDLAYKKAWCLVEIMPCDSLRIAYLIAQEEKDKGKAQLVVPVAGHKRLGMEDFSRFMNKIQPPVSRHSDIIFQDGIVLAIVDGDSTVVYYRIQNGIVPPDEKVSEAVASMEVEQTRKPPRRRQRGQKRKFQAERSSTNRATAEQS